jgi:hypothetical protein
MPLLRNSSASSPAFFGLPVPNTRTGGDAALFT